MSAPKADPVAPSAAPLLALVSDVVLWLDAELCILRANEAAERLLRQPADMIFGLSLEELVAPSSRKSFAAYVEERRSADAGAAARRIDVRITHLDVVDVPVEISLHRIELEGKPGWLAAARDLTERRLLRAERNRAESLEEANSALREAMLHAEQTTRVKTEFLANVSHEIRTPMTAILGFTEVLLEEARRSGAPATVEALRTIQRNGDYLLALLNDILDLSKIESGRLEVERVTFSPVAVVREVERLMHVRAEAKGIGFQIEFDGALPEHVEGDPTRVRQILINLVGNAIKFTEIGEVRLRVSIRDERSPARLRLAVVDTGIGITPAERAKLFRPFGQADSSTTRRYGGTGLGLTISKRLTDLLDGTIEVESEPGRGTTFVVEVPAGNLEGVARVGAGESLAAPEERNVDAQPALSGTVLLVEDGPDNQRLIELLLRRAGLDVVIAENGQQAVERVQEARVSGRSFALVLMDMQMPVMDGYTATRILRRQGFEPPIVALTAHAMDTERSRCMTAGCDDFATKPIDRARFYALLRRHLGEAKTA
jgi:PAS domain S-box-containing protein